MNEIKASIEYVNIKTVQNARICGSFTTTKKSFTARLILFWPCIFNTCWW